MTDIIPPDPATINLLSVRVRFPDGVKHVPAHMADPLPNREPGSPPMFVATPDPQDGWQFDYVYGSPDHCDWVANRV